MNCRIRYDFIAQTRTVVDEAPSCGGYRPAAPDALRPSRAADDIARRHFELLAALRAAGEERAAA